MSTHSDNCYFNFFYHAVVILRWNFLRFHEFLFQTDTESKDRKFQLSILKNKTKIFLNKSFLSRCPYQNKKALFTDSIFRDGFGRDFVLFKFFHKSRLVGIVFLLFEVPIYFLILRSKVLLLQQCYCKENFCKRTILLVAHDDKQVF